MAKVYSTICDRHKLQGNDKVPAQVKRKLGLDDKAGMIDLCADCDNEVQIFVGGLINAGEPVEAVPAPARKRTPGSKGRAQAIRSWCKKKGIDINERGRIPAPIEAQYDAEFRNTRTT